MPIFRPEKTSFVRFGRVEAQIASRKSVFMVAVGIKYAVVGETGRRGETRTRKPNWATDFKSVVYAKFHHRARHLFYLRIVSAIFFFP